MLNLNEIVLLDDNEDTNFYNEDIIEETKLFKKITVSNDGLKLLEELKNRISNNEPIPAVFLVDIKMPNLDGFEFLDELDSLVEDLEVQPKAFILSTSTHKRDEEQFKRSYLANHYLHKPLTINSLLAVLK